MTYVGIDPGRTGAAVAVGDDGLTVVWARSWRALDVPPDDLPIRSGDVVAVEAQYVGLGAHSSLRLAEWTGGMLAGLPRDVGVMRPLATTWRAKVLRQGRLTREAAKEAALVLCHRHAIGMPAELAWLVDVAEAWCMARYAWGWSEAVAARTERE